MVNRPKAIPHTPGVYLFKKGSALMYIGKALDLHKRLTSYFRKSVSDKVARLRAEATAVEWSETASEIEALIREAELIRRYVPKYNVLMRDDKSYLYVATTREQFPRVVAVRKTMIAAARWAHVIGPFISGSTLYATLKLLRRIFPYCTCRMPHKRPCWNAQIGRCLGFCCGKNQTQNAKSKAQSDEYAKNIKNVVAVLSGKRRGLSLRLKKEMREASHSEQYERAALLRDQAERLEDIFRHRHTLSSLRNKTVRVSWPRIEKIIRETTGAERKISRVEGYDISNISGTSATGSMVVFVDGMAVKSEYRKFKIKTVHQPSDVDMHREVIRRRLVHPEWPYPELIVIDGGKPQLNAVLSIMREARMKNHALGITLSALAKREEELYTENGRAPVRLDSLPRPVMHFFQRVRDESHRFAKQYHHKLREISYRGQARKIKAP